MGQFHSIWWTNFQGNTIHKIISPKYFVHKDFKVGLFVVVALYKDDAVVAKQFPCHSQPVFHKHQPATVREVVVVGKAIVARIVGRVDVDKLNLACEALLKRMQYK